MTLTARSACLRRTKMLHEQTWGRMRLWMMFDINRYQWQVRFLPSPPTMWPCYDTVVEVKPLAAHRCALVVAADRAWDVLEDVCPC
jgi:hypothetical protein